MAERFTVALSHALPDVPPTEILWRLIFSVGSMVHALQVSEDHLRFVATDLAMDDLDTITARMVGFLSAGFEAPATDPPAEGGRP